VIEMFQGYPKRLRKLINRNRFPKLLSEREIFMKTGKNRQEFENACYFFAEAKLPGSMSLASQVLCYYEKVRKNCSFEYLAANFNSNEKFVAKIFTDFSLFKVNRTTKLPQFSPHCQDEIPDELYESNDPYILGFMGEEFLGGRKLLITATDRSYLRLIQ